MYGAKSGGKRNMIDCGSEDPAQKLLQDNVSAKDLIKCQARARQLDKRVFFEYRFPTPQATKNSKRKANSGFVHSFFADLQIKRKNRR